MQNDYRTIKQRTMNKKDKNKYEEDVQEVILAFLKWGAITFCIVGLVISIYDLVMGKNSEACFGLAVFGFSTVILIGLYPIYFKEYTDEGQDKSKLLEDYIQEITRDIIRLGKEYQKLSEEYRRNHP